MSDQPPVTNAGILAAISATTNGLEGLYCNETILAELATLAGDADVSEGAVRFDLVAKMSQLIHNLTDAAGFPMNLDQDDFYRACGWERHGSIMGLPTYHLIGAKDA